MRMHRTLAALVGLALLGSTPIALAGSASAAEADRVSSSSATTARALPKREVKSKVVEPRRNKLVFKGNVNPGHENRGVYIQKKNCKGDKCSWYKFKKVQTDGEGRFKARIEAPRNGSWFWRAKVKKHGGYGTSYSDVWRTYTI